MKKRIPTQKRILETLRELKEREGKDWWPVNIIILWIYRRWQIDKSHKDYKGDHWGYRPAESVSVFRAIGVLEKRKKILRRRVKTKDRYDPVPKEYRYGGVQVWTEVSLREE